ncbi:MAG: phosphate ABC transporter permease subunit PstC [Bacteroidota bacterium]
MVSGTVTTVAVLLIIIFLFKEGVSLFGKSPLENNISILVNEKNPLTAITAAQIKDISDQKITNWKQIGGADDSIILVTINELSTYYTDDQLGDNLQFVPDKVNELVGKTPGILGLFSTKNLGDKYTHKYLSIKDITIGSFLFGKQWFPTATPAAQMGILPLILGTLWVSFGAILFALPIGIAAAIYLAEIAGKRMRNTIKPIIELLSGIPSVVFGFFGLVVIVPIIQKLFHLDVGETGLAGSIVLAIMALPTIITVSEDAMRTTPRLMKEASLALGATQWQTIVRVIIPYSFSGISAAAILGIGRAIGETMAVIFVTGSANVIPHTLLQPMHTIPAVIAAELGEVSQGGRHYKALFALGCVLFIMTFIVNLIVQYIFSKRKHNQV